MEQGVMAFTAVFLKAKHGYVGFVEELPDVSCEGRTLEEARRNLVRLASVVFEEERAQSERLIAGEDVVREAFRLPIPR